MALARPFVRDAPVLYRMLRAALRPLVAGLLRPRVEGVQHVPASGPAILCGNHLSVLDPVVVGVLVPRTVHYLAKREVFGRRWRWLFAHLGVIPVAREGGLAGESSLDRGGRVLHAGALLALYPEGTRSPDGRLYRGKTGAVRLAIRTGAPIVPIGIVGTRNAMPPHARVPRRAPVVVRFGPAMDMAHLRGRADDRSVLRTMTDELMSRIAELSGQVRAEEYAAQARAAQAARRPVDEFDRLRPDDDSLTLDDPGPVQR
jgi:1-acyl-sn-glycerol-3-phosphate acyltransferase